MLVVERSNRTEALLEGLADRLTKPGADPLATATVVVQGPGMERWLAQSIARRAGVCANVDFLFPRGLLDRVFGAHAKVMGTSASAAARWEPGRLAWAIARLLAEREDDPEFDVLRRQVETADADWRRVQLAHQIAAALDRTVIYRPEWTRAWETDPRLPEERDARWQAHLYRALRGVLGSGHLADRTGDFLRDVDAATLGRGDHDALRAALDRAFPDRIEIFAVSTLPPLHLSVIDGLARLRDVHLSVLSPTRAYWADLWHEVREAGASAPDPGSPAPDTETPELFASASVSPVARLLSSLGRLGGDFQRCLEERLVGEVVESDRYRSPLPAAGRPTLLQRLQGRILDLGDRADGEAAVAREDDSIRVHVCHGARRELEVVEAALREAFERDETLMPEDVIVMAPRIDEIASDIETVFGVPDDASARIEYRIADRSAYRRSPVADAFRGLLELLNGRATRSEVLDWLANEAVRTRFGLDEEHVELASRWAERAGVRFGLDAAHREALGLSADPAHTWVGGLDRLALAHAVGAVEDVFAGTAAVPAAPFAEPSMLGGLGDLVSLLSATRMEATRPRSVADWCVWLRGLLDRGFARNDVNTHEHVAIRTALAEIAEASIETGFEQTVRFEAIREVVGGALAATPAPQAFLSGGVTFCELVPLRAIPFRVVVIVGLSDEAFPRGGPAAGFDLVARDPRPGDRHPRHDDRHLFLEAVLSARDRLILTVPGRDLRDGSSRPPSIVVTELIDVLTGEFALDGEPEALDPDAPRHGPDSPLGRRLVVTHPLQAFSPAYFETARDGRLAGRDEEAYRGALAHRAAEEGGGGRQRCFLHGVEVGAAVPSAEPPELVLEELIGRILRATRHYARERLQLRMPRGEDAVDELDPLSLGALDQALLGQAVLEARLEGEPAGAVAERLAARAAVPPGLAGEFVTRALKDEVETLVQIGRAQRVGDPIADRDFVLELESESLGRVRLAGLLDHLHSAGRLEIGFHRLGRYRDLATWIHHLVLCACVEEGWSLGPRSVRVGRPKSTTGSKRVAVFGRVDEPRESLTRLFEWAWSAGSVPLPFFPKSSWAFAQAWSSEDPGKAWRDAYQKFHGGDSSGFMVPEIEENLELARLWEGLSPLEAAEESGLAFRFSELALGFFEPMFAAREDRDE